MLKERFYHEKRKTHSSECQNVIDVQICTPEYIILCGIEAATCNQQKLLRGLGSYTKTLGRYTAEWF